MVERSDGEGWTAVLGQRSIGWYALLLVITALGGFMLLVEAANEPLHMDELRQVQAYGSSFADLVRASFRQTQPPLDALLNAALQRVVGVGDVRQRLLSVFFGTANIALIGLLARRAGLGVGALVATAYAALSPVLVSVSAYARPYALPLFLILSFVLVLSNWLQSGGRRWFVGSLSLAFLLPLSRTTEPMIVLAVTSLVLLVFAWRIWDSQAARRARQAVVLAWGALAVPGTLTVVFVRKGGVGSFSAQSIDLSRLSRLVTDVPAVIADQFPAWPLLLVAVLVVSANRPIRAVIARRWWWWTLLLLPFGFMVAFLLLSRPGIEFFDRYLFSLVPATALIVGATAEVASGRGRRSAILRWSAGIIVIGVLSAGSFSTYRQVVTATNPDFEAAARGIRTGLPRGATIVIETPGPPEVYRHPFWGDQRYLDPAWRVVRTPKLVNFPNVVGRDARFAVLLWGSAPEVDGWWRVRVDPTFHLYLPKDELPRGPQEAAEACERFADELGYVDGSSMYLAAASLYREAGATDRAEEIVRELIAHLDGVQREWARGVAEKAGLPVPLSVETR